MTFCDLSDSSRIARNKKQREKRKRPEEKEKARIYKKAYYQAVKDNPEFKLKSKEFRKKYVAAHRDHVRDKATEYRVGNSEKRLFLMARARAKRMNIEFNLDPSDIVIPEFCPYLGIRLTTIQGKGRVASNVSLDKIDPSKGYTKGNVQVISSKANMMKNDASPEALLVFANNVLFQARNRSFIGGAGI